jgi:hypothetical protein
MTTTPKRWTRKAALAAYEAGTTEITLPGGRKTRVVTDAGLETALTSWPKTGLHKYVQAGPTSAGRLEVRLS